MRQRTAAEIAKDQVPHGSAPPLTETKQAVRGMQNWKATGDNPLPIELPKVDGIGGDAEPVAVQHIHGKLVRVCNEGVVTQDGKMQPSKCSTKRLTTPTASKRRDLSHVPRRQGDAEDCGQRSPRILRSPTDTTGGAYQSMPAFGSTWTRFICFELISLISSWISSISF